MVTKEEVDLIRSISGHMVQGQDPKVLVECAKKLQELIQLRSNPPTLDERIASCKACKLIDSCTNKVPGEGPMPANIMCVGEAPGQIEDEMGRPFVGPAGKLLNNIIGAIKWKREDIFICNIVKCRPPNNRTPEISEVVMCKRFLDEQIELVQPKLIICWGSPSANTVIHPNFSITKEHGVVFSLPNKTKAMAIFHPAYILRLESVDKDKWMEAKKAVWEDIQKADKLLKGEI